MTMPRTSLCESTTITATIELLDAKTEGMIVTHGGLEGGYGLYLRDGKPVFVYNFLSVERTTFAAKEALAEVHAAVRIHRQDRESHDR